MDSASVDLEGVRGVLSGASYVIAWVIYLISAVGLTCVFWRMTRSLVLRRTRRSLRALVAVILFTPINMGGNSVWLVPAYLVGAYDGLLGHTENALRAGVYISSAYVLMISVILLESVMRRLFGVGRAA